jgi:hypothetical protein
MWDQLTESQNQDSLKCCQNAKWKSGRSEWANEMFEKSATQHTQHSFIYYAFCQSIQG